MGCAIIWFKLPSPASITCNSHSHLFCQKLLEATSIVCLWSRAHVLCGFCFVGFGGFFGVFILYPIPNVNFIIVAFPPTASSLLLRLETFYYNVGFFFLWRHLKSIVMALFCIIFWGVCMSCLNLSLQDVGFFAKPQIYVWCLLVLSL